MTRKGRYRRAQRRARMRKIIAGGFLAGWFVTALYFGNNVMLGMATSAVALTVAWLVLRKLFGGFVVLKRVLALAFIGLGIALDKQTRQTFRETWEENHPPINEEEELTQTA